MYAILISAFNSLLGFVLRKAVIKFVLFGAIYVLCTSIPPLISAHLPDTKSIQTLLNALPDGTWFFLNVFEFPKGVSMFMSAYFVRFFIRRIPFFG